MPARQGVGRRGRSPRPSATGDSSITRTRRAPPRERGRSLSPEAQRRAKRGKAPCASSRTRPESNKQPLVPPRVLRVPATAARARKSAEEPLGRPHRHIVAALPDPPLDRAEQRQRRGPRWPTAGRGLVPMNRPADISAWIGRAPQGLPAGKEEKGVESPLGSRLGIDEEARGAPSGGTVPGGCRLGTLFDAKDVTGSGGSGYGRLQIGNGEMRSSRASTAPTRLSETTRLPRTLVRPSSRRRAVHPGRPARYPAWVSPRASPPS